MTSVNTDRLRGTRNSLAIKAPCVVATTANITLSGTQTIDGVAVVVNDRVLVKNQTTGSENGIYVVNTGTWQRAADFEGANNAVTGTLVKVNGGAVGAGFWYVTTAGAITIGTTAITFAAASSVLAVVTAYMQTVLAAADATTAFSLLAAAGISVTGDISPTALSANTDNWAPTGFASASTIRMDASAAWNLTGIAAGSDGRLLLLHNISAFTVTLKNNVTSTAANRFLLSADYALAPNQSVLLEYDATSSRWRIFGQQTGSGNVSASANRMVNNVGLSVAMAGNAVTIALKGADGNDPTGTNTCTIGFRNATLTNGAVNVRSVTAALSTNISAGSTGGTTNGTASRIWIAAIDNAGNVELAWYNTRSGINIAPINEGGVITTIAEGGAGGATSAQTWYSTTARANVPFTILGYFDSTQATAGTWAAAADVIVVNPRYRPGDVIQLKANQTGAVATGTTALPNDDTIPQNTEGDQYMTQAITPTAAANLLEIKSVTVLAASPVSDAAQVALFQDSTANALAATRTYIQSANVYGSPIALDYLMVAATTSSTTFKIRAGNTTGATTTFNGTSGSRAYGGVMNSFMQVKEIVA